MSTEEENGVVTLYEHSMSVELTEEHTAISQTGTPQVNDCCQTASGTPNNQSQLQKARAEHTETTSQHLGTGSIRGQQASAAQNTTISKDVVRISSISPREQGQSSVSSSTTHGKPHLHIQPESTMHYPNRQQSKDTETDAKPSTPMPDDRKHLEPNNYTNTNGAKTPSKSEQMRQLEHDILRPTNHNDQRMTKDHLVDVVVVFAKSDYELAKEYQQWLQDIASQKHIHDIKIELYTSEKFPANDVKVVEDVVNRAMRVLMLLSSSFEKEVSLTFIKEEAIGLTRLQEMPKEEMISLFASTIMNRKKNCVRPVHTQKQKYYRTPVGLSALRAFNFFEPNKSSPFEKDITGAFLKSAHDDRMYHTREMMRHQATNNSDVSQAEEERYGDYYNNNQTFQQHDIDRDEYQHNTAKTSNIYTSQGLPDIKGQATDTSIVGPSAQQAAPETTTQSQQTNTSVATSGYSSGEQFEEVLIGKIDSLQQNRLIVNSQSISQSCSFGHTVPHSSLTGEGDIEKDASASPDVSGEVKEHRVSYTGPSGRSGIRTGSNPEFGEYMVGVPTTNGQQTGNSSGNSMNTTNNRSNMQSPSSHYTAPPPYAGPPNPQSVHYHYHYNTSRSEEDLEVDEGPVSRHQHPRSGRTQSPSRHEHQQSPPPVRSGPVFNIQGCATVQIGDGSRVIGNQNVQATNNIGSVSDNDTVGNDREGEMNYFQRAEGDQSSIEEAPLTYTSHRQDSLNDLSPISDPDKLKNLDKSFSSVENSDDDNSYEQSQDKTIDSEDMFGNGNDSWANLSSSFTDKSTPEKSVVENEVLNEKTSTKDTCDIEDVNDNEKQGTISTEYVGMSSNIPSSELPSESIELTSLSTQLRLESRKKGHILYYYNTQVQCSITCSDDVNADDEID